MTQDLGIPDAVRYEVCETLLAACKIDSLRRSVMTEVEEFIDATSPLHLHAGLAIEKSIFLRLNRDYEGSERAISDYCVYREGPTSAGIRLLFQKGHESGRIYALHGLLHQSHLENIVQNEGSDIAVDQLSDWEMPLNPSPMDLEVLVPRALTVSKLHRALGQFDEARKQLETAFQGLQKSENPLRSQVLCALIDVYSDLDQPDRASAMIQAEDRVCDGAPSKALRRLWVSVIDNKMQKGCYDEASEIIKHLLRSFQELESFTVSDELLHARVLIADTRIHHLNLDYGVALEYWDKILTELARYASFQGEGATYAVIHLSITLAHIHLGNLREAEYAFRRGRTILRYRKPEHWILTLPK